LASARREADPARPIVRRRDRATLATTMRMSGRGP